MSEVADLIARLTASNDYTDMHELGDAGIVCINRFMFTYAILSNLSEYGYEGRWCFSDYAKAKAALDAWDGADGTEPNGWHRHPSTGRRRSENGDETVAF